MASSLDLQVNKVQTSFQDILRKLHAWNRYLYRNKNEFLKIIILADKNQKKYSKY